MVGCCDFLITNIFKNDMKPSWLFPQEYWCPQHKADHKSQPIAEAKNMWTSESSACYETIRAG
jgi:hypothetical protein